MVEQHNRVVADVISKYCANNPSSWDQMIPYLNFVYNTTVHKTTGQTPFSLVFGQECKYPIHLLLPKAPGHEIVNYEFTRWLNEQFGEAHVNARETLGYRKRQKDLYQKNVFGEELKPGEKVWLFAPQKAKSRKFFLPWIRPYNIIERTSEVNYKISKDKLQEMADSPLQSIEACEGGRRVTQNGNKIISSGEMAQPPKCV